MSFVKKQDSRVDLNVIQCENQTETMLHIMLA